jgi:DNA repair protein RadC
MQNNPKLETLEIAFASKNGDIIGTENFGGIRSSVQVPLREIAKAALRHDAQSVIVSHNHPSGDPKPSRADLVATRQIVAALRLIGVTVHDHHIVAGDQRFSFRDAGLI